MTFSFALPFFMDWREGKDTEFQAPGLVPSGKIARGKTIRKLRGLEREKEIR